MLDSLPVGERANQGHGCGAHKAATQKQRTLQAFASQGLERPLCTASWLCGYCASQCTWLTCAARCCACRMVLPDGYDGFTAAKKQEVLWKQCEATKYISKEEIDANNTDASGFESLQIFVNFYTHATLKEETDELFRGRKKVIHRRGWCALQALGHMHGKS